MKFRVSLTFRTMYRDISWCTALCQKPIEAVELVVAQKGGQGARGAPVQLRSPIRPQAGVVSFIRALGRLSELQLVRIRSIKQRVLEVVVNRIETKTQQNQSFDPDDVMARVLIECADELLKLDDYERKARSRRKKAFRALYE